MTVTKDRKSRSGQFSAVLIAGIGGCLPSLCSLAAASSKQESVNIISAGHLVAMTLYFLIGSILCFGVGEKRRREAFLLGIAAPAIIASFLSGSHNYEAPKPLDSSKEKVGYFSLINSAYADTREVKNLNVEVTSQFWNDFKRGMGFNVDAEIFHTKNISLTEEVSSLTKQLSSNQSELKEIQLNCIKSEPKNPAQVSSSKLDISQPLETCPKCIQCPVRSCEQVENHERELNSKLEIMWRHMALNGIPHLILSYPITQRKYFYEKLIYAGNYQSAFFIENYPQTVNYLKGDYLCKNLADSAEKYRSYSNLELYDLVLSLPEDCIIKNSVGFFAFSNAYFDRFYYYVPR